MNNNYKMNDLSKKKPIENKKIEYNNKKVNNSKGEINRKYIIKHNKLKISSLSKYINKANHNNNHKKYDNNNSSIKKINSDEYDNSNPISHRYKNRFYINNTTNDKYYYFNKYSSHRDKNQNSLDKNINYITNKSSAEKRIIKKRGRSAFLFPDKRFIKMRILINEKYSKKIYKKYYKDKYNININKIEYSNLINYFTNISTLIRNKDGEKITNIKIVNLKDSIDLKNNEDYYYNKYIKQNWALFPFKLDEIIKRKIIYNYGYFLLEELYHIYTQQIRCEKKNKLINIIRINNKKIFKYYFRKFRDNTLIEKVKQIYEMIYNVNGNNKNIKMKQRNKKRIKKKNVEIFLTKTTDKSRNNNLYIKKINLLFDKLRLILFKNNIKENYIYLKEILINKHSDKSDKKLNNNNKIKKEEKRAKRRIKIKFVKRFSNPNLNNNENSISCKTSSSDYSKSTIHSTKRMKVYKRIVNNFSNNNNLEHKMNNIILKLYKKEMKHYFYKWNNNTITNNNTSNYNKKAKSFDRRFFYFFLTKIFYYKKNLKIVDSSVLLGYSMFIWKRYSLNY